MSALNDVVHEALRRAHEVLDVPMERYHARLAADVLDKEVEKLERKAARAKHTGTKHMAESQAAALRAVADAMRAVQS